MPYLLYSKFTIEQLRQRQINKCINKSQFFLEVTFVLLVQCAYLPISKEKLEAAVDIFFFSE